MSSTTELTRPLVRAKKIYRRVARHDVDRVVQRKLARPIKRLADEGVKDPGRLTVYGLTYLREIDSGRQPL